MKNSLLILTLLFSNYVIAADFDVLIHESKITNEFTNISIRGLPVVFGSYDDAKELADSTDVARGKRLSPLDSGAIKLPVLTAFCRKNGYSKVEKVDRRILPLDEDRAVYSLKDDGKLSAVYELHKKTHDTNIVGSNWQTEGALLQLRSITCSRDQKLFEIL